MTEPKKTPRKSLSTQVVRAITTHASPWRFRAGMMCTAGFVVSVILEVYLPHRAAGDGHAADMVLILSLGLAMLGLLAPEVLPALAGMIRAWRGKKAE